jgi:hypothetical protein
MEPLSLGFPHTALLNAVFWLLSPRYIGPKNTPSFARRAKNMIDRRNVPKRIKKIISPFEPNLLMSFSPGIYIPLATSAYEEPKKLHSAFVYQNGYLS